MSKKCITFDKTAIDSLPEHIKDKMKADRDKTIKSQILLTIGEDSYRYTDFKKCSDCDLKNICDKCQEKYHKTFEHGMYIPVCQSIIDIIEDKKVLINKNGAFIKVIKENK